MKPLLDGASAFFRPSSALSRASRAGSAIAILLLVVVLVRLTLDHHGVRVRASAHRGIGFPGNVVDETPRTEWTLPDKAPGWIEIEFPRPRAISTVLIMNGEDRGVGDFELEAWAGSSRIGSTSGSCSGCQPRKWLKVELRAEAVTRVRLIVRSWTGAGAAVAEFWAD